MRELQKYRITFLPWQVERPGHPATSAAGWITVLAPDEAAARVLIAERVGEEWHLFADDPFDDGWINDYPLGEIARWSTDEPVAPPARRSGLLEQVSTDGVHHTIVMRLYCWTHKANHLIPIADIERVVYALGAMAIDPLVEIREPGRPNCQLDVLEQARIEDYQQFVDLSIANRAESAVTA